MEFVKYQALGNDYIVIEPGEPLSPERVRALCDRHYGIGGDGILFGPLPSAEADFGLRIFNPDGSEAEKSGNGLRIFARYLWECGWVGREVVTIATPGGRVTAQVHPDEGRVTVAMGRVSFDSADIPVAGPRREVLNESLVIAGQALTFCAVTIGNPHCVVLHPASAVEAQQWGALIERLPIFPNRTNVQFLELLGRRDIRLEIWERGAGYTLASGSSSCAAAAVAFRLGWVDAELTVRMPGGVLSISIGQDWAVTMTGEVKRVFSGRLEAMENLE